MNGRSVPAMPVLTQLIWLVYACVPAMRWCCSLETGFLWNYFRTGGVTRGGRTTTTQYHFSILTKILCVGTIPAEYATGAWSMMAYDTDIDKTWRPWPCCGIDRWVRYGLFVRFNTDSAKYIFLWFTQQGEVVRPRPTLLKWAEAKEQLASLFDPAR